MVEAALVVATVPDVRPSALLDEVAVCADAADRKPKAETQAKRTILLVFGEEFVGDGEKNQNMASVIYLYILSNLPCKKWLVDEKARYLVPREWRAEKCHAVLRNRLENLQRVRGQAPCG